LSLQPPLRLGVRRTDAHKGSFGRVLLAGGSRGMSGSIAMSAIAALRTGAGLVTVGVPDRCLETVASFHPCVMTLPLPDDGHGRFSIEAASEFVSVMPGAKSIGCGPGMTMGPGPVRLVERLLAKSAIPRVLDADAINILALLGWPEMAKLDAGPLVLTPHPGELARLSGASSADRVAQIAAAKRLAERTGAIIVVKGGPTVVVAPETEWTNQTGNPGMATAGSGDVLTGVITSLLAQGLSPLDAARLGVWTHGLAGDLAAQKLGQSGMTAVDILDALPQAIAEAC
jgi:ADP-dependent NAD(P)H-hydrate dehydratase